MAPGRLRSLVLDRAASGGMKHLRPVGRGEARGLVALVYRQVASEYQLVPPLTLHSPVPDLMAALWGITRESFLAGAAGRVEREAVAATVSQINACPFCVEAHAMSLHGTGRHDLAETLVSGGDVVDPDLQSLLAWAAATRRPGSPLLLEPPFHVEEWPHFMGTVLLFHYINRMVHVFLGDSPLPALPGMGRTLRRTAGTMLMGRATGRPLTPGLAEGLQRPGTSGKPSVRRFRWAAGAPEILQAWQNFDQVIQNLGERHVPAPVRLLVQEALEQWRGQDMGLSRAWAADLSRDLPEDQRSLARLSLLVGLASHQVDDQVVHAVAGDGRDGARLVSVVAWASAMGTFRIGEWIAPSAESAEWDGLNI